MKNFHKFTEDIDKVAALKAKQRAAVDKFKSSETPVKQTPERKVHSGDVDTQNMIDKKTCSCQGSSKKSRNPC